MGPLSQQLVLITGATGHIGFKTLAVALLAGYRMRVSVRRAEQASLLKSTPSVSPFLDSVEFVVVPDITAPGAFDEAVKDVQLILHIASPIPDLTNWNPNVQKDYLEPAIHGTTSVLESAAKSPTVKRVVITSSVAALELKEGKKTVGPYDLATPGSVDDEYEANPWIAYSASKKLAHEAATKFMEERKPSFDLVRVMPSYTQGRNELVSDATKLNTGSNDVMVDLVKGTLNLEQPALSNLVLVDDVADVHVKALDPNLAKNGDHFIASGNGGKKIDWNDVYGIVKKLFPEQVKSGLLPLGGEVKGRGYDYEVQNTISQLGFKSQGLEVMVESLIGQYVELAKN